MNISDLSPAALVRAVIDGEITPAEANAELRRRERERRPDGQQIITHLSASAPKDEDR
jgi:hypothetical protein